MTRKLVVGSLTLVGVLAICGIVVYQVRYESLPPDVQAESILIEKSARRLTLLRHGTPLKSYRVALGHNPVGPKQFEGDGRTPEGRYVVDRRKRDSSFHLALHISYPRADQVAAAGAQGRSAGSDIMIHGLRNGLGLIGPLHRLHDWTQGCIAVTNGEIEELWRAVPDGTPVEIRP